MRAVRLSWRGPIAKIEIFEPRFVLASPNAMNGAASVHMNHVVTSQVMAFDADMNALTLSVVAGAGNGTVAMNPNGSFTYTPNTNFVASSRKTKSRTP